MSVQIPASVPAVQREVWQLAGRLFAEVPNGWTIVGGQMVQFHGWRMGVVPGRVTTDLDAGIAARSHPDAFPVLTAALQDLGLRAVQHDSGIEHRWVRDSETQPGASIQIDVLLPSNLGQRARRSINGAPGVQSRGVQWATDLSEVHSVRVGQDVFEVPVPGLVGALVAKASALLNSSDVRPRRHLDDLSFLCGLARPSDFRVELAASQRARLEQALRRLSADAPGVAMVRLALER
ncbi:MAG: hypothetical protein QM708_11850 [Propioniciclava sp.]|uniref:hypothetical protein n=1 Tax=Propioniciclava sp. TaxID=2038686 RepID=UPI0039E2AFEB